MIICSIRLGFLAAFISIGISSLVFGQSKSARQSPPNPAQLEQHEKFEGKYTVIRPENMKFSPAYRHVAEDGFFIAQVNVSSAGENIIGDAANEPSIAIDPGNPERMAIGWRQFNTVLNNFRQAGYGYSTDAGHTWTFPAIIDSGVFRSDPVLDADASGTFYYNSLTSDQSGYSCQVFRSENGGTGWGNKMDAYGGDKQWMIADKTESIGRNNLYSFWTMWYSICYPGSYTRGPLGGLYYEPCGEIPDNPYWGTMDVDRDGVLYIGGSGSSNFSVVKSTTARDMNIQTSWDTLVSVNLDGYITYGADPNPGGLAGQAWLAVDKSTGPTSGNIYLLCSVARASVSDPLDVMFSRSTDGGLTWSAPLRINDDESLTNWQWFGTMSVAPTGRIDAVWLDTRDNPGTVLSALYYSCSTDGGLTWSPNKRLSDPFNPHLGWPQQNKMGDYFHMISDSAGANLAWAATFNGEEDVYFSWIPENPIIPDQISFSVDDRWNLVSVPVLTATNDKASLFPTSISDAFLYDGEGYVASDLLENGGAYWLKFGSGQTISIAGDTISNQSVGVGEGWNMIGSVSSPIAVSSISSDPPGLAMSEFFGYDQSSYVPVDSIIPGKGYWVKSQSEGTLFLSSGPVRNIAALIRISPSGELPPLPPALDGEKGAPAVAKAYALEQNYPNPFNSSTLIRFRLPVAGWATIKVFDLLGQEVATLVNEIRPSGEQLVRWDAGEAPNGVYYYRLASGTYSETRRMILMK